MPIVTIAMLEGRNEETKQKIATEITALLAKELESEPEHIYVLFEDVPATNWAYKGKLFSKILKE